MCVTGHKKVCQPFRPSPGVDYSVRKHEEWLAKEKYANQQYMSQHVQSSHEELRMVNLMLDGVGDKGVKQLAVMAPGYKSGINPNFFSEYFSQIEPSDLTDTPECKSALRFEYENRRWSYLQHLFGYNNGITQKVNRKLDTVEFWRRFGFHSKPPAYLLEWYFNDCRKIGDMIDLPKPQYVMGISDILHASFSNCPVPPKQTLKLGHVHVVVGFVDLGILLDVNILPPETHSDSLLFRGFEASPFAVAKSLVVWKMMRTAGMKPNWVVQVWFSTIWSKQAMDAFLVAVHHVVAEECVEQSPKVRVLVQHWAGSKGVSLEKLIQLRSETRSESSDALFFSEKKDRIEMIRYHLTGAFGLSGEASYSCSVLMFDCPPAAPIKVEAQSVLHTLTLHDVVSSRFYDGNYFRTAEKVKESRVSELMKYAQTGRIKVELSVAVLALNSPALEEIVRLQPNSCSWSNILDYVCAQEFHTLAQTCGPSAKHSGYSMNWQWAIYGSSLIDYPETSLEVIDEAQKKFAASMYELCPERRIFLTPIQHNPLNVVAGLLAERCHPYWIKHFFGVAEVQSLESGMLLVAGSPLCRTCSSVWCSWNY